MPAMTRLFPLPNLKLVLPVMPGDIDNPIVHDSLKPLLLNVGEVLHDPDETGLDVCDWSGVAPP